MTRLRVAAALIVVLAVTPAALATNYGVFVDGSYSPGDASTAMDRLIDGRLADADRIMGERDPQSRRQTVDSKEALRRALAGIRCTCQDTVTVVLMGHGEENRFIFSKARRDADRRLGARELADLLEASAAECCCKIHVVIFACHSGSFLDELFQGEHIESVYASSRGNELSYSDAHWLEDGSLYDGGDWVAGFNEDWRAAPAGGSLADALLAGFASSGDRVPERSVGGEHPVGWRRGELAVLAHVEERPRRGKLKLHYYDPPFLRSTTAEIDIAGVTLPDGLAPCQWVSFRGRFGRPAEGVRPAGAIARAEAPHETVLAHVEGASRSGNRRYLIVHTLKPRWQYCKRQRLYVDDPRQVPAEVQTCTWIEQPVTVEDPEKALHTGEAVRPASPVFPVKMHVSGTINHERGTFTAHVLEPPWLRCNTYTVQLPAGERGALRAMNSCRNVLVDLDLRSVAERTQQGRNVRLIHQQMGSWAPRYDVALNVPSPLSFTPSPTDPGEPRSVTPGVAVTNTGRETASCPVRAVIGRAEDRDRLEDWLRDPSGQVEVLWRGDGVVEKLVSADTMSVEFPAWTPPEEGGRFWAGFSSEFPGDEIPENDVVGLVFEIPPAPSAEPPEEEAQGDAAGTPSGLPLIDLGALERKRYPFPITAKNISCKGKHDFEISIEFPAAERSTPWIAVAGPRVLSKIAIGQSKTTDAIVDLTSVSSGEHRALLRVRCITCPPPPLCTQNVTEFDLRVVVE